MCILISSSSWESNCHAETLPVIVSVSALQKPSGGVRGIVVGDIFWRMVGRTMCSVDTCWDRVHRTHKSPNTDGRQSAHNCVVHQRHWCVRPHLTVKGEHHAHRQTVLWATFHAPARRRHCAPHRTGRRERARGRVDAPFVCLGTARKFVRG